MIALPARPSVPRFDVGGPVIAGDIAVVASSQFGFLGVDYRRGQIAWTKPAGEHVAPPVVVGSGIALLGDCVNPPDGRATRCSAACASSRRTGTDQRLRRDPRQVGVDAFAARARPAARVARAAQRA